MVNNSTNTNKTNNISPQAIEHIKTPRHMALEVLAWHLQANLGGAKPVIIGPQPFDNVLI